MEPPSVQQASDQAYRDVQRQHRALICILAIALFTLLLNLNGWSVLEAQRSPLCRKSAEKCFAPATGCILPLLGIWHYHKPPVIFWLTSLGYQLFGVNAFGARFFSTAITRCSGRHWSTASPPGYFTNPAQRSTYGLVQKDLAIAFNLC